MKKQIVMGWIAAGAALAGAVAPLQAAAHGAGSEASLALSLLPVASVVGVASVGGAAASTAVSLPAALSVAGAVLTVKDVEVSAEGTVYVLERASDGARASVRVLGRAFAEPTLFRLAYGWERTTTARVPSPLAPELTRAPAP